MSKRRSSVGVAEQESLEVLGGRRGVGARRLIELIRAVNPTGLDLHPLEEDRRYSIKSRLQSLLLRNFGEERRCNHEKRIPRSSCSASRGSTPRRATPSSPRSTRTSAPGSASSSTRTRGGPRIPLDPGARRQRRARAPR